MTSDAAEHLAEDLHEIAIDLAGGAAELVRARSRGPLDIASKSSETDLVTQVDRDTERWLVDAISRSRPGDSILGEEGGAREGSTAVRWLIDPIDGTVNFVLGIPFYGVSVAAEVDGVVVAGAVVNPVSGESFHARLGAGAWLGDQRLPGPRDVPLERAVIGTGFGYSAALRARQVAVVAELLPRVSDIRRIGASSLEWCYVAAGRLDGYFEAALNPWDYAAGALIAAESGCVVGGLRGEPISALLGVAAGARLAPELFGALESIGAAEVNRSAS
ncbi:MAG TPA: inositol monophosphatase family protein [Jatrophihabitantaceae bacterium]|jgi:myo-inositol-1(or 4)-monophosphatase|nr:inositol monophosphatase family protein [Jatrophihabitantaceae bacterium]